MLALVDLAVFDAAEASHVVSYLYDIQEYDIPRRGFVRRGQRGRRKFLHTVEEAKLGPAMVWLGSGCVSFSGEKTSDASVLRSFFCAMAYTDRGAWLLVHGYDVRRTPYGIQGQR
jgi:hypothetical protein